MKTKTDTTPAPAFRPLPTFGGTLQDRMLRSSTAANTMQRIMQSKHKKHHKPAPQPQTDVIVAPTLTHLAILILKPDNNGPRRNHSPQSHSHRSPQRRPERNLHARGFAKK